MKENQQAYPTFGWRVLSLHVISYFAAGILALIFLNYRQYYNTGTMALLMRPANSATVAAGAGLQVVNGFFMSLFLFPFRSVFLTGKTGWMRLFFLIFGFAVFSPQVPGPGTFEGLIYTKISISEHLHGLPESLAYSLLFSILLSAWYKRPARLWNILAFTLVFLIILASVAGVLDSMGLLGSH